MNHAMFIFLVTAKVAGSRFYLEERIFSWWSQYKVKMVSDVLSSMDFLDVYATKSIEPNEHTLVETVRNYGRNFFIHPLAVSDRSGFEQRPWEGQQNPAVFRIEKRCRGYVQSANASTEKCI